jgi:hypothetical protein
MFEEYNHESNLRFVYSMGIDDAHIAELWDNIAFESKQDSVIKALKIVCKIRLIPSPMLLKGTFSPEILAIATLSPRLRCLASIKATWCFDALSTNTEVR